jgi:hypothetical protein
MDDRKWRVKIPGQPPSMNHMYKEATQTARDKWGAPVYWKDGRPKTYRTKVKADGVHLGLGALRQGATALLVSPQERHRRRQRPEGHQRCHRSWSAHR